MTTDLTKLERPDLEQLCDERGKMAVQAVREYEHSMNTAINAHTELQSDHAAREIEIEALRADHAELWRRFEDTRRHLATADKLLNRLYERFVGPLPKEDHNNERDND